MVEQLDAVGIGERDLLGGILVGHDGLSDSALDHKQVVAASGKVDAAVRADAVPHKEFLGGGVHIRVVGLLVEVVTDHAVILRGQNEVHHGAGHAVHEVILGGFALLNDGFQLVRDGLVGGQVQHSGLTGSSGEERIVQLGSHTQDVVCGTTVQNAVNAVQADVLLFQLLDDLAVGVDGDSDGLCLHGVALACGTRGAVVLGGGIDEALGFDGAGNGIAGQVHVLHGAGDQRLLDALNGFAVQLGKIFLAVAFQQDVQCVNTRHNSYSFVYQKILGGVYFSEPVPGSPVGPVKAGAFSFCFAAFSAASFSSAV